MAEQKRSNGGGANPEGRGPDQGHVAATLLDKTKEFFQTCDVEEKGFITRTDMRRLHRELPLSAEELEDVFDSLDTNHDGYLTLEAFSSGFSQFLRRRRISVTDDPSVTPGHGLRAKEALYQSQWDAKLAGEEDDEENHFSMLLDSLGASSVFEDPGEVRSLWAQLRRDEPHLLSNFEEFLARVTSQIKEAQKERKDMESALQRKAATHDSEIRSLYEEMEAQIKNEKDLSLLKDAERLQVHSQEMEQQLFSKERELDHLIQKQRRLEVQCRELQESRVENVKLKKTNDELSRDLEGTNQELALAQEQLTILEEQATRLQQDKEMELYRVTEGLHREKQSLMKQLDLLREMNKHLKDERDISFGVPRSSLRKKQKQRTGLGNLFDDASQPTKRSSLLVDRSFQYLEALPIEHLQIVFVASSSCSEDDAAAPAPAVKSNRTQQKRRETPGLASGCASATEESAAATAQRGKAKAKKSPRTSKIPVSKRMKRGGGGGGGGGGGVAEDEVLDAPPDGWPLRRVISIEEDHLPHLLHGGSSQPLLHQLSEEDEEEDDSNEEEGEVVEEEEEAQSDPEGGNAGVAAEAPAYKPPPAYVVPAASPPPTAAAAPPPTVTKSRFTRMKKAPMSPRGQPVGKETQHGVKEGPSLLPERLFKVLLIGNSSVGKTSLLRSFCEGRFHTSTTATVGIDYSVKSLTLDNTQVAMQLWDTAGQERYRSITKQFFRKADGVVLMYDITVEESFRAVRPWLANVQDAAGEGIPILLIGNKMDMEGDREVSHKEAEQLAYDNKLMFSEVSAYTGCNVTESLTHLARVLKEQEDRVRDTVIILSAQPVKKKACCK